MRRIRKLGTQLIAGALVALGLPLTLGVAPAQALGTLSPGGDKTVDKATANGGDQLFYQIPYFCASSIPGDNCNGTTVTDVIPTFTDVFGQVRPLIIESYTSNGQLSGAVLTGPSRVVWTATNLQAGESGALSLVLRIPTGLTPAAGTTIVNKAAFRSGSVTVNSSNATTTIPPTTAGVVVTKTNNKTQILAGSNSTYTLRVCPAPGQSHFPNGYVLSDDVPAGATVVSTGGGTQGPAGHVEWTFNSASDPGFDASTGCFSRTITVNYPAGTFPAGTSVTNNATADPVGPGAPVGPVGDTDTIRNPIANAVPFKTTDAGTYVKDEDPVNFAVGFSNTSTEGLEGETTLQSVTMVDGPLPKGFEIDSIKPGEWNNGNLATVAVSSTGPSGPWTTVATADGTAAQNVVTNVPSLANEADGTNRYVRWTFAGILPTNFAMPSAGLLTGSFEESVFLPAPGLPQTLTNCQTMSGVANVNGTIVPVNPGAACASNILESPQPNGSLSKTVDTSTREPGEIGTFTLAPGNDADATGNLVVSAANPATITDCMPAVLVRDSVTLNGWTQVTSTHTCPSGKIAYTYRLTTPTTVAPGGSLPAILVTFHVSALGDPLGAAVPQTAVNDAQLLHSAIIHCTTTDCRESEGVGIPVSSSLRSRKQVAGYYDAPLTGPGVYAGTWNTTNPVPYTSSTIDVSGDTYPGGWVDFQIAVLNSGNADVKNFTIVDVLPYVGDTGVKVTGQSRYTQFTPTLKAAISVPTGYLVEYSTSSNPCRPEVSPIGLAACDAPAWTATPASFGAVRSFRVTLPGTGGTYDGSSSNGPAQTNDNIFEVGEEVVAQFRMITPVRDATYDTGGSTFFPYENLNTPSQIDIAPATQTRCRDENNSGDDPSSTTDRCPVARNSFAYAGIGFSPTSAFVDTPLGSEAPRVDLTVYAPPGNGIGDYVWFDTDADGRQDTGEVGVANVRVQLVDAAGNPALDFDGNPVPAQFTDADGYYGFYNLANGNVKVRFFPPAGYRVAPSDTGDPAPGTDSGGATLDGSPNTANDSDGRAVTGQTYYETPLVALQKIGADGEFDFTWDLGIYTTYAVGDYVWYDANLDGVQQSTELPVVGATAKLFVKNSLGAFVAATDATGAAVADDTTDANGRYVFDNLLPGTYRVRFTHNVADYGWTTSDTVGTDATDSDALFGAASDTSATTAEFDLNATATNVRLRTSTDSHMYGFGLLAYYINPTIDAGISQPYTLGNLVWEDTDDDGLADVNEPPIAGVEVDLYLDANSDGVPDSATPIQTVTTAATGKYLFTGLRAGNYVVVIAAGQSELDGLRTSGTPTANANLNVDNDNNGVAQLNAVSVVTSWRSGTMVLGPGGVEPTNEVGGLQTGTPDEDSSTEDRRGNWTVDFGFHRGIRIGNQVWLDGVPGSSGYDNGVFDADASETAISGVRVELWRDNANGTFSDTTDTLVDSTTTDTEGNYWFENLEVGGTYFVAIKTIPGTVRTRSSTGSSTNVDLADNTDDGAPTSGYLSVSSLITIAALGAAPTGEADTKPVESAETEANAATNVYADGNSDLRIDFGFVEVPLYRLGNLVWNDIDKDGIADPAESGVAGVRVELYDSVGGFIGFVNTDVAGNYLFESLTAGAYEVRIPQSQTVLAGYFTSPINETSADLDGDNNDNGTLSGAYFTAGNVTLGENNAVGAGAIYNDEPVNEVLRSTSTTDDDPGTTVSSDARGNLSVDFAFYRPDFSIGNEVWFDVDDDGIRDSTESPVPDGVIVNLLDASGNPARDRAGVVLTTTIVGGLYLFDELNAGTYIVEVAAANFAPGGLLVGYGSSTSTATENAVDGDDNGSRHTSGSLRSSVFTLSEGDEPTGEDPDNDPTTPNGNENLTVDFGIFLSISLGDVVWLDLDRDGAFDSANESPVAGVVVNLLWDDPATPAVEFVPATDANNLPVAAQTTDVDGRYQFTDLRGGTYQVVFTLPAGYRWTTPVAGGDTSLDSDANFTTDSDATAKSAPVYVDAFSTVSDIDGNPLNLTNPTIDAGIWFALAIGDYVWFDDDNDGIQESGEAPVAGVTVMLLMEDPAAPGTFIPAVDLAGNPVASTTTDANGHYVFDGLAEGTYKVKFSSLPTNYRFTDQAVGSAVGVDSNPDSTGVTPAFELRLGSPDLRLVNATDGTTLAGLVNPSIDAGIWQPLAVGDYVWIDRNHNGVQDAGEQPIGGITVALLNADGTPARDAAGVLVPVAITDAAGHYVFDNLAAGDYMIQFGNLPEGYLFTKPTVTPSTTDSDADATGRTSVFSVRPNSAEMRDVVASDGVSTARRINPTIDAGIWQPLAVGDYVWVDLNRNGIQDNGEPGVAGVTVELLNADGTPARNVDGLVVLSIKTDANGHYVFDNLLPGDYKIRFTTPPKGSTFTVPTATGSTGANNSDVLPGGMTAVFTLSGTSPDARPAVAADGTTHRMLPTIDAGLVRDDGRSGALPVTGGAAFGAAPLALGLLGGGLVLAAIARRRRAAA